MTAPAPAGHGHRTASPVSTPDECVAFVNAVGLCVWQRSAKIPSFPSLEAATRWDGDAHALMMGTWFWKDDLHIEKRLFYGLLLGSGTPLFVSLALLPTLIAAQGDNDAHTLYEKNRLTREALTIYEHVERAGATASNRLPVGTRERTNALVTLQQRFLLTKSGLSGRTRGTYGYIWGICEEQFPDAFRAAAKRRVEEARREVREHLESHGVTLTKAQAAKLFRWTE